MPNIFLSPSTQEYNEYVTDFNEEYYMNLIADAMEPYLQASGITFTRNDPNLTVGGSVRASNAGNYDFHIALHSNASPAATAGQNQGSQVYYYLGSSEGERAANIFAENLKDIYPYPQLVQVIPSRSLYELANTIATTVLIELAFHDNYEDAQWIKNNIDTIAKNIVLSLTEYFGIPFVDIVSSRMGTVATAGFDVNIRETPSFSGNIVGVVPNGAQLTIISTEDDWYKVDYNGMQGYIYGGYIILM